VARNAEGPGAAIPEPSMYYVTGFCERQAAGTAYDTPSRLGDINHEV